jgi:predicted deacetylase
MLIVTIHDVAPPTLPAVVALRELVGRWGAAHATLLAVPNFHGRAPLVEHVPTVAWLRRRADAGDEVALHGMRHLQTAPAGRVGALRARLFTAGEAEMLGAGAVDPDALAAARGELGELVKAPIHGFVAPAWLEPRGLDDVLSRLGFGWHETGIAIERLRDRRRTVSPVIGFATRSAVRTAASLAWAAAVVPVIERTASVAWPVRVALHPGDLASGPVLAMAARAIRRLVRAHPAVTTSAALGIAGGSCAGSSTSRA